MVASKPVAKVEKVGERNCPNCNADAVVVVERVKPRSVLWTMYVSCPKCQGKWPIGLMHDEHKRLIDRRAELSRRYDKAKTPRERGIIYAEVKRLEKREEEWTQSL